MSWASGVFCYMLKVVACDAMNDPKILLLLIIMKLWLFLWVIFNMMNGVSKY